jgi:hypothetical protein
MEGMSEREYSAHSGLSRVAIQKARKSGRLVVYSDGSINTAASDLRRAEALVFRLVRQKRDTWVNWPSRVAALMAD